MSRRLLLATGLLVAVIGLLVLQWPQRGFWYDETVNASFASRSWTAIWEWCTQVDNQTPLHFAVLKLWGRVGGTSEYALRVVSVWMALLSVAAVIALGKRLAGASAGWLAGAAYALTQSFSYAAFEVRPYALALALFTSSSVFLWELWQRYAERKRPLDRVYAGLLTGYVALVLGMLYAHYTAMLGVAVHGAIVLWRLRSNPARRGFVIVVHLVTGIALGYAPWMIALAGRDIRAATAYTDRVSPLLALETHLQFFVHGQRVVPSDAPPYMIAVVVTLAAATLLGLAVRREEGKTRRAVGLALVATWLPLASLVLMVYGVQAKLSGRHAWMVWPALALLVGSGLSALERERLLRWPLWAGALLVMWLPARADFQPIYNSYLREAFAYVRSHAEPADVMVLRDGTLFTAAEYYDAAIPWVGLPPAELTDVNRFLFFNEAIGALEDLIETYDAQRVWVLAWQGQIGDPQSRVEGILEYVGQREPLPGAYGFGDVSLGLYRLHDTPDALRSRVATLAPLVQAPPDGPIYLGGYVLNPEGVPRGGFVRGHTWWLRGRAVRPEVRVSMRLYDMAGAFYMQFDQPPVSPSFGQENWLPGEPVLSRFALLVPPDMPVGEAVVNMILYDMAGSFDPIEVEIGHVEVVGPG